MHRKYAKCIAHFFALSFDPQVYGRNEMLGRKWPAILSHNLESSFSWNEEHETGGFALWIGFA